MYCRLCPTIRTVCTRSISIQENELVKRDLKLFIVNNCEQLFFLDELITKHQTSPLFSCLSYGITIVVSSSADKTLALRSL